MSEHGRTRPATARRQGANCPTGIRGEKRRQVYCGAEVPACGKGSRRRCKGITAHVVNSINWLNRRSRECAASLYRLVCAGPGEPMSVFDFFAGVTWLELSKVIFSSAFLLGFGAVVWKAIDWLRERWKEARERRESIKRLEIEAHNRSYSTLADDYSHFLELLLDYPHLGVAPLTPERTDLSADDQIRRNIFYDMVGSMCEQAWLDRELTADIANNQWPGWERFLISFIRKPSFRSYWKNSLAAGEYGSFDLRFEEYVGRLIATAELQQVKQTED